MLKKTLLLTALFNITTTQSISADKSSEKAHETKEAIKDGMILFVGITAAAIWYSVRRETKQTVKEAQIKCTNYLELQKTNIDCNEKYINLIKISNSNIPEKITIQPEKTAEDLKRITAGVQVLLSALELDTLPKGRFIDCYNKDLFNTLSNDTGVFSELITILGLQVRDASKEINNTK